MGRGDYDFLERDIADSQDQMDRLGSDVGGVSRGIVTDLVGLFDTPNRARAAQAARLAEASEYLAPQLARERGISEDEARAQIAGGVQEPEPGYQSLGRLLGLVDAPQGEPFNVRMGKLRGMAARTKDDEASRKEGMSSLGDLIEMSSQLENPDALHDPMAAAARRAGLGDISNLKFKPQPFKNLWHYVGRTGKDPIEVMQSMNARRRGAERSARPTAFESFTHAWTSGDPALRAAARAWKGGGRSGSSRERMVAGIIKGIMDNDLTGEVRERIMAEGRALAEARRRGEPDPPTPTLDSLQALEARHVGADDASPNDIGHEGYGYHSYEDHDDILDSIAP